MSWLQSLRGKCAVVTGSTSGIGQRIVSQFAKVGCRVMLHGLEKESEISGMREQLAALSKDKVAYSNADLTDPTQCKSLIEQANEELGKVDILVNKAGVQYAAPVHEFPPDKWNWLIAVNLNAPYHLTRAVIKQMYDRNWGRIINIASAHGKVASKNKSAYCASKHGIIGFAKSVALEAAGTGVTSNAICPGWVLTPLVKKQIDKIAQDKGISFEEAKMELLMEKQPSGKYVNPEDLGAFAVFLSSDAASQVTGAALSMDGAWTVP